MLAALASCTKQAEPAVESGVGELTVNVVEAARTKAAYTTAQPYEETISFLNVYVYDSAGKLTASRRLGSGTTSCTFSVLTGPKTVVAVANYDPDDASALTYSGLLNNTVISMDDNSKTTGFVMMGSKVNFNVSSSSTATCNIALDRVLARVALRSITNSSGQTITIKNAVLNNVVSETGLEGDVPSSPAWINKEGRKDETTRNSTHIIDGSTYAASCPTLTFKSVGQTVANGSSLPLTTPYLFYCCANDSQTPPTGFHSTFSEQQTVLTVTAVYNGTTYYYPVVIASTYGIRANYAYTVDLTITGPGSDDPVKPVSKGSMQVSVYVSNWSSGEEISETI